MSDPLSTIGPNSSAQIPLEFLAPSTPEKSQLKQFKENQPPLSECARIGQRQLSWLPWVYGLSQSRGSFLDRHNFEASHQHIFFDSSGDNIGWSNKGIFSENSCEFEYKMDPTCYDGALMRQALGSIEVTPTGFAPSLAARIAEKFGVNRLYGFLRNNCQDFVSRALAQYKNLLSN